MTGSKFGRIGILGLSGWRRWSFWFAAWTVLGIIEGARLYYRYNTPKTLFSWIQALTWGLLDLYLWGIFSIVIVWFVRRLSFDRKKWLPSLILHILIAAVICMVQLLIYTTVYLLIDRIFFQEPNFSAVTFGELYGIFVKSMINTAVMMYFLIAFVSYAMLNYQKYRDEEVRLAETKAQLAQAQLTALKMQLHPHFLFNTLNAITALIHSEPETADRMISRLAELLRITLDTTSDQEITLRQELDFLNRYLDIQKMRYRDRLEINYKVSPRTLEALVPSLLLQPIVENAVRFCVAQRIDKGVINVTADIEGQNLHIAIADNGPGTSSNKEAVQGLGTGLANIRERLRRLYGDGRWLAVEKREDGGFATTIKIPFKTGIQDGEMKNGSE